MILDILSSEYFWAALGSVLLYLGVPAWARSIISRHGPLIVAAVQQANPNDIGAEKKPKAIEKLEKRLPPVIRKLPSVQTHIDDVIEASKMAQKKTALSQ